MILPLYKKYNNLKKEHESLKNEFEQYKRESIKWSIEDIIDRAKELKHICSEEQAQDLLEEMISNHDATQGISWDTIDIYVYNYCELID